MQRVLVATVLGSLLLRALALDDAPLVRSWQTEHGLPQVTVRAVAQTHDGFLWVGTDAGLARFDGVRFVSYGRREGLPSVRVRSLLASRDGSLWVGFQSSGLTRVQSGVITTYTTGDGLPRAGTLALAEDPSGNIWIGTNNGVVKWDGTQFIALPKDEDTQRTTVLLARQSGETLAAFSSSLRVWRDGVWAELPDAPGDVALHTTAIAEDSDGNLWVTTTADTVWRRSAEEWRPFPIQDVPRLGYPHCIACGRDGSVYVGYSGAGLWKLRNEQFTPMKADDGSGEPLVESLLVDRDGLLWIGSHSSGLLRLSMGRAETCRVNPGGSGDTVRALLETEPGVFWVGTLGAGLWRWENGKARQIGEETDSSFLLYGNALLRARDGSIWLGAGNGLYQFRDGRRVKETDFGNLFQRDSIYCLAEDSAGTIWAGCGRRRIFRVRNGKAELFRPATNIAGFTSFAVTADGALWAGMNTGGILRIVGDAVTRYRRTEGLGSNSVISLCVDSSGTLWAGTFDGGLACFRDDGFISIGTKEGLPEDYISQIIDDGAGQLWIGGRQGVAAIALTELHAVLDGKQESIHAKFFSRPDGMASANCTTMVPIRSQDGRVCFGTMRGFVRFAPNQLAAERSPPKVFVEDVLVNGTSLLPNPGALFPPRISLDPGRPRVDFHFAALDLIGPEDVRFRYRLVGLDRNWVDAGTRRVASFSRLAPGQYRFEVGASAGGSGWVSAPATLDLVLRPYFWETAWFNAGCVLGAVLAGALVVRTIAKRRLAFERVQLERQRAVDAERTRIAKDLHDDLGANLTQIALLSELAKSDLGKPEAASEHLEQIFSSAKEVARTMDEIVWAVNPIHDTIESFIAHIANLAQKLTRSAGLRFRFEAPERLPATPLSPATRHHLYLAVKEAIHNVIRHAAATQLRVIVDLLPDRLSITVEDNGRGFEPSPNSASHGADGWLNLHARMAELGGECLRRSAPGAGTTVELRVPISALQS